ncbi:hypothetical protein SISNIDRAFT_469015 [Sistotremastrum niveocremeum HHB9708]|uniref:Uncharacterized protein n=1 Tax=Sistotremastrum niveocremeum HHB9708 TaxID=1314777 RepID=A0A164QKZ1_9AGAM|nr:hypothetical protein SISNIDRAFT_469015 [Sistotremastrum niveocremeum HHB9708]
MAHTPLSNFSETAQTNRSPLPMLSALPELGRRISAHKDVTSPKVSSKLLTEIGASVRWLSIGGSSRGTYLLSGLRLPRILGEYIWYTPIPLRDRSRIRLPDSADVVRGGLVMFAMQLIVTATAGDGASSRAQIGPRLPVELQLIIVKLAARGSRKRCLRLMKVSSNFFHCLTSVLQLTAFLHRLSTRRIMPVFYQTYRISKYIHMFLISIEPQTHLDRFKRVRHLFINTFFDSRYDRALLDACHAIESLAIHGASLRDFRLFPPRNNGYWSIERFNCKPSYVILFEIDCDRFQQYGLSAPSFLNHCTHLAIEHRPANVISISYLLRLVPTVTHLALFYPSSRIFPPLHVKEFCEENQQLVILVFCRFIEKRSVPPVDPMWAATRFARHEFEVLDPRVAVIDIRRRSMAAANSWKALTTGSLDVWRLGRQRLELTKEFRDVENAMSEYISFESQSSTGANELAVWEVGDATKDACIIPTGEAIFCLSWIESSTAGWTLACGLQNGVLLTLTFNRMAPDCLADTGYRKYHGVPTAGAIVTHFSALPVSLRRSFGYWWTIGRVRAMAARWRRHSEWAKKASFLDGQNCPPVAHIQALGSQSFLAILFKDGGLVCLSMQTEEFLWDANVDTPIYAAGLPITPQGLALVTMKNRGELRFHYCEDVANGESDPIQVSARVIHHGRLGGPMAWLSPDFVLVGGKDCGNADVWDVKSGRIVEHLNHDGTDPSAQSSFHPHSGLSCVATVVQEHGQSIVRVWESVGEGSAFLGDVN